jgi:hypothetical protein
LSLFIQKKYYRDKVATDRDVDHQMPHQMVVFEPLFCVKPSTDCVEDTACGNQYKQWQ